MFFLLPVIGVGIVAGIAAYTGSQIAKVAHKELKAITEKDSKEDNPQ